MKLRLDNEIFVEISKISSVLNSLVKIIKVDDNYRNVSLECNISYKTIDNEECFKSLAHNINIDNQGLKVNSIDIENVNTYVAEGYGVGISFNLVLEHDNEEIEIIDLSDTIDTTNDYTNDKLDNNDNYDEIKNDIKNDYEKKLDNSLRDEKSIIVTKAKVSENDFLSYFDTLDSDYYSIKTLSVPTMEDLNLISKKYNIPYQELLYGYDEKRRTVIFKLKR